MKKHLSRFAKDMLPTPVRAAARGLVGWRWFDGDYASWAEARAASGGYDDAKIVARVAEATRAVRSGDAAFERDGVKFPEPVPETGLMHAFDIIATAANGARWDVLDFGGALGSTYWRHHAELSALGVGAWDIVEQPGFVRVGQAEFSETRLRFFPDVRAAEAVAAHRVLFASTVLQYLEDPISVVGDWMDRQFPWILLNNLPLIPRKPNRLAVQNVPPEIYPASYPVWFFNREEFMARFNGRYDVVSEFASEAVWQVGLRRLASKGLLLRKRTAR